MYHAMVRRNCRVRLGSLWSQDLAPFDLAFAFLSPILGWVGTAVTAVGATVFDEFFATETHATVTTVACFYFDRYFIYKLHNKTRLSSSGRADKNQDIRLLQK